MKHETISDESRTYVVLVGIHRLSVKSLFPFAFPLSDMLADPHIPIEAKYQIHATRQRYKVAFQAADERRRDRNELAITELYLEVA